MKANAIQEILKDLKTVFSDLSFTAYNEIAPSGAVYPFFTYELDNSFSDGEGTESVILYVDGWDLFSRTGSTVELETKVASVLQSLYRRKVQPAGDTGLGFWYMLDSRRWIRDPEDDIRHRRLIIQVRVFGKE